MGEGKEEHNETHACTREVKEDVWGLVVRRGMSDVVGRRRNTPRHLRLKRMSEVRWLEEKCLMLWGKGGTHRDT